MIYFHSKRPIGDPPKLFCEGMCSSSSDIPDLPIDVADRSNVVVLDTGNIVVFHENTTEWREL